MLGFDDMGLIVRLRSGDAPVRAWTETIVTVGAQTLAASYVSLPVNGANCLVLARVGGSRVDAGQEAAEGYWVLQESMWRRRADTTEVLVGATVGPSGWVGATDGSPPAGWSANTRVASGTSGQVEVTGVAGATIRWKVLVIAMPDGGAELVVPA